MRQITVKYPLFGKALSDLFGILAKIENRMNNNPVSFDNIEDTKRVSRDEQTAISAPIKPPNKRKPFKMLKPQLYILQKKLFSPLTVLFNPVSSARLKRQRNFPCHPLR